MMSTDRLIEAVHERPLLWNQKHPMYRNRIEMTRLWMEIAKELQHDCRFVKSRWKGLRDYYRAESKKLKEAKDGRSSTWPYFDQMDFLKDSMTTRIRIEGTGRWDRAARREERRSEVSASLNELLEVTIHDEPEESKVEQEKERNGNLKR